MTACSYSPGSSNSPAGGRSDPEGSATNDAISSELKALAEALPICVEFVARTCSLLAAFDWRSSGAPDLRRKRGR